MWQSSSPGLPYPAAFHLGAPSGKVFCFVSTCAPWDYSFLEEVPLPETLIL